MLQMESVARVLLDYCDGLRWCLQEMKADGIEIDIGALNAVMGACPALDFPKSCYSPAGRVFCSKVKVHTTGDACSTDLRLL